MKTCIRGNWLLLCAILLALLYYANCCVISPKYEVYAFRVGISHNVKRSTFIHNATGRENIAWIFWLIKNKNTIILVDSGFTNKEDMKVWRVEEYVRPDVLLSRFNISPESVTDIILTHAHWDHAGGVHLFPNAKVWIQKGEFLDSVYLTQKGNKKGYRKEVQEFLDWLELNNRLKLFDGNYKVQKGIQCELVGNHTNHSQAVLINSVNGKLVITGDEVNLYENIDKDVPIKTQYPERNRNWIKKTVKLVSKKEYVLPSHDPAVFKKFPKVAPSVVKIE
ncbi:MAG: N-acyl homoserine lactonase family protein [Candidatus Melainabacteria bacterium]|nr:N-acyl homoserine lactonase family protein [Candidatus Melainabacteria bacterium]